MTEQAAERARTRTAWRRLVPIGLVALVASVATGPAVAEDDAYEVDPETGYRMERYRAPVPASIPDGITLDIDAARALHEGGEAVFIDVYPPRGLGPDPIDGHWVISESHDTLPGATWLPEVGRGHLEPEHLDYLERNLVRLSEGDTARELVFFCTADCWQSWNVSKRVIALGYAAVHWFPLGTDGWREHGLPVEPARPLNFFDDQPQDPDIGQ